MHSTTAAYIYNNKQSNKFIFGSGAQLKIGNSK